MSIFEYNEEKHMQELNPELLKAEAVVFVSPIYYYDINAQIKAVIDRFYANNSVLKGEDTGTRC